MKGDDAPAGLLDVFAHHLCRFLLVDEDDNGRGEATVAEDILKSLLLLLVAVDELDSLLDRIRDLSSGTDSNSRWLVQILH